MDLRDLIKNHIQTGAWEKDKYFLCLREHLRKNDLIEVVDWLYFEANKRLAEETKYCYEWKAAACMMACASFATLEGEDAEIISMHVLNPLIEMQVLKSAPKNIANNFTNPLRRTMEQFIWPSPFNTSWAWDAVRQFQGNVDQTCQEEITILLYDFDGLPAKLYLDAIPGIQPGMVFFPDPRSMTFVQMSDIFYQAIQMAADFSWQLAEAHGCPPVEVRWWITRIDEQPLKLLDQQSVGAAFALGFSKLLNQYTDLVPSR